MATKLDKKLKREVDVNGVAHTLTVDPEGVTFVKKGCRNGRRISFEAMNDESRFDPVQNHKG